tara:strand:+ start:297 stop:479 length:183 start_codon:yes stop_codon:yes gene_type:complete
MIKGNNPKTINTWIEEICEGIEIQFYGIIGALIFFILLYFLFHPMWMHPLSKFIKDAIPF